MMIGAANSVFLDTNILVYANVSESSFHQAALQKIQNLYDTEIELWVSRQVLREFIVTLTRPQAFTNPRPITTVIERVRFFQTQFRVAEDSPEVTEKLLSLIEEIPIGGKQMHDANIVATMLVYEIPQLLTHNTGDFTRFSNLITVSPLQA
ncbi:MAG: type II toxin-antitoxin system VapC family toxin [Nostoc sp. LLA-1]|nr:type II toxin-antitoxin system VapC family toxin [Cyanocohniella sp. LLY]